ncbi:MAG: hypothetical protein Q7W44_02940 [Coriobacteriia bacterium]|nr:hypothetical protein [Coriobacteriia bacterium]
MAKAIGSAADFYRVRIMRVDATEAVDFEWRDDILYRRPESSTIVEDEWFRVEAVLLDDEDVTTEIATFDDADAAQTLLDECQEALADMTKSGFEERYLGASVD